MIWLHIFMTAAHCGGPEWTGFVRFFRIDEDSTSPGNSAQATSQAYYAQTFPWQIFTTPSGQEGDVILWWIEDGDDKVPPGIKYGYLELSPEIVKLEDQVYSFWVNPVGSFNGSALSNTLLHSTGSATSLGTNFTDFG